MSERPPATTRPADDGALASLVERSPATPGRACPVPLAGVTVHAGDPVVVDDTGVAGLPADWVRAVLPIVQQIVAVAAEGRPEFRAAPAP